MKSLAVLLSGLVLSACAGRVVDEAKGNQTSNAAGGGSSRDTGGGAGHSPGVPIACGDQRCDASVSYCDGEQGASGAIVWSCVKLPEACAAAPSCDCIVPDPPWAPDIGGCVHPGDPNICEGDAATGFTVCK